MSTLTIPYNDTEVVVATTWSTREQLRWLARAHNLTMKQLMARLVADAYAAWPQLPPVVGQEEESTHA